MNKNKKKIILKYEYILPILFTIIFYIQIYAGYQDDSSMSLNLFIKTFLRLIQYIFCIVILGFIIKKHYINKNAIIMAFFCFLFTVIPIINNYSKGGNGILTFLFLILFFLSNTEAQYKSFIYCRYIWVILSIISIFYFISYIYHFPLSYIIRPYYFNLNNGIILEYIDYRFCFLYKEGNMIRLCGICNEPGYFGTLSALFLCADNLKLKEKKNIIIFIAGCLTSSLAFFVLLLLYFLFSCYKNKRRIIIITIIVIFYIFILSHIKTGNETIDYFLRRIEITDKSIIRNSRSNAEIETLLEKMLKNSLFWGFGSGYSSTYVKGLSYKTYLIDYGILGFVIMYGSLFLGAIHKCKNFKSIIYILIFFISIYQRPDIFNMQYILLLFGGLSYILYMQNKNINIKLK